MSASGSAEAEEKGSRPTIYCYRRRKFALKKAEQTKAYLGDLFIFYDKELPMIFAR
jgi:hypothetical protein